MRPRCEEWRSATTATPDVLALPRPIFIASSPITWPEPPARRKALPPAYLAGCLGGYGALDSTIKPIDPAGAAFFAPAVACATGTSDNLAFFGAVAQARPGEVIAAASEVSTGPASIG